MGKKNGERGLRNYYQISIKRESVRRFQKMHKQFDPKYSATGFFDDLLDVYEKIHCPECKTELKPQACHCKDVEKL